ncbi:MAG: hypothetical protein ABSA46_10235 [Thermodesulfovibrionales bacterium]|jgi:hypothetical protein
MSEYYSKALVSQWGYATFQRGRVLCMRLDPDKVVLIEPEGGYMYLDLEGFCTTPRKGKIQKISEPGEFESDFEGVI